MNWMTSRELVSFSVLTHKVGKLQYLPPLHVLRITCVSSYEDHRKVPDMLQMLTWCGLH